MIKQKVLTSLEKKDIKGIHLLTPKNPDHGDYAFHVKSISHDVEPIDFKNELFSNVERTGDFINLTISPIVLIAELTTILEQKERYGSSKQDKPKKISLEYGQPNTHKLPHIGHLFSYTYGESIARLLDFTGEIVFRCNYQGDVGLHVSKCLYVIQKEKDKISSLKTPEDKVQFLQKCYQDGSKLYEEDENIKKDIDILNKKIYERNPEIVDLWQQTRRWSIDYYAEFEKRLGTVFNKHYFESESGPIGKALVEKKVGGVFEKSDGAIVFRGENYGLHTRVFVTSVGNPTYEAKDVGLVQMKYTDWPFDVAIITTAREQNEYWRVVIKAIELTLPDLKDKVKHIGFGMVDLKSGKMSSRTGNIISAVDLVNQVEETVSALGSETADVEIRNVVSQAAIKYAFLRSEAHKNISFDINESISTQGNSGPYLLYAYARAQSVIARSETTKQSLRLPRFARNDNWEDEELSLLRTFFRFPEVVEDSAKYYAPHLIATYLFDLAQKFNLFYEKHQILKAEEDVKQFRLALTAATAQLLKNGLYLLGIEVLDKI